MAGGCGLCLNLEKVKEKKKISLPLLPPGPSKVYEQLLRPIKKKGLMGPCQRASQGLEIPGFLED